MRTQVILNKKEAKALEASVNLAIWVLTKTGRTQAERHASADAIVQTLREAGFEITAPMGVEAVKVIGS